MQMPEIDLLALSAKAIVVLLSAITGLLCWLMQRFIRQMDVVVKDVAMIAHRTDDKYYQMDHRMTIIETQLKMRRKSDYADESNVE